MLRYKNYDMQQSDDEFIIYKNENIVGAADTEVEAKQLIDKMIAQGVNHESELQ